MNRRLQLGIAGVCLLLQACASTPSPPAPPTESVEPAPIVVLPAEPTAYEVSQRARAVELERQGQLAEAVLIWEVLSTIRPRHEDYRERWQEARRKAAAAAAERVQRGDQAAARGQLDTAATNYLAALALQPDQQKAADGLRGIERERVRRNHIGKLSRHTLTRRAMSDAEMTPPASTTPSAVGRPAEPAAAISAVRDVDKSASKVPDRSSSQDRIEVEHASLLASQGEYDEAIAMLDRWLAAGHARDEAANSLLADVLFQKAESVADADPATAIAALERSIQLNRKQPRAAQRLKQLNTAAAPVKRK